MSLCVCRFIAFLCRQTCSEKDNRSVIFRNRSVISDNRSSILQNHTAILIPCPNSVAYKSILAFFKSHVFGKMSETAQAFTVQNGNFTGVDAYSSFFLQIGKNAHERIFLNAETICYLLAASHERDVV